MIDLGALKLSISVDSGQAKQDLQEFNNEAENGGGKLSKLGGIAKTAAVGVAAAGTAIAAGATAAYNLATKSAETADRIDKMSQKIGISKESFQEWDYVCNQSGVDVGVFQSGLKTLTTQMDSAASGSESATEAFNALGLSWEDGNGKLKNQETMMEEAIAALASMEDGTKRARLAQQLFGKAGTELAPILNSGTEGIAALKDNAHALGLVMSDEAVVAGVKLGDTIADVKSSFQAVFTHIGVQFMPLIQQLAEWILANMPTIQAVFSKVFETVGIAIDLVTPIIQDLMSIISSLVEQAQTDGTLFNAVWEKVKIVFETVITAIQNIFAIFKAAFEGDWSACWEGIKTLFSGIWDVFKKIFENSLKALATILSSVWGTIKQAAKDLFNKIKEGFSEVWTTIKEWFSGTIGDITSIITGIGTDLFNAGKAIFTSMWDGLKSVWESISTWVSDKVSWLIDKLAFWRSSKSEMDGSHRTGLREVPYDGYVAELHRGEMVLTAAEANQYQNGNSALINALGTQLALAGQGNGSGTQTINLTLDIGGQKFGETVVTLGDEARSSMGIQKVVKVS